MISNTLELREKCPYCTPSEYQGLKSLGASMDPNIEVVMIGAGPGQLLMSWLEGYPYNDAHITVIDIDTCNWTQLHIAANQAIKTKNRIDYVIGDSYTVGRIWSRPLDFLIVDGDHRKPGVLRDIEAWHPHLKANAVIWLHDYDPNVWGSTPTGVREAIIESCVPWMQLFTCGCSAIYINKENK